MHAGTCQDLSLCCCQTDFQFQIFFFNARSKCCELHQGSCQVQSLQSESGGRLSTHIGMGVQHGTSDSLRSAEARVSYLHQSC